MLNYNTVLVQSSKNIHDRTNMFYRIYSYHLIYDSDHDYF